jgi:glycosyltransferase involved in cell wall biosynthesis
MKIIQVCPKYYPEIGGVEAHVKELSEWLVTKGFDVEVVCTDPTGRYPKSDTINGVQIHRFFSLAPFDSYFFCPQIAFYLKSRSPDVIHAHNYRAFPLLFAAFAAQTDSERKFIITTHLGFSKTFKFLYKIYNFICGNYVCKKATKIIIVSPAELEEIPFIKKYQNKITWIPNGVNLEKFSAFGEEFQKDPDNFLILFVGRIEKKKGIDHLITIAHNLRDIPFQMNIVGDGPDRNYYENIVIKTNVQNKLTFKGRISENELFKLYAQSHIFLLLSEYEAHSIALTEAMASGAIPIVTNVGGNPYIVKDGITGFVLEYPVQKGAAEKIIKHLWQNRDFYREISKNARNEIKANYEINHIFEQIQQIYDS